MTALQFDPRTKIALMVICIFCASFAPNIFFRFALVLFIGLFGILCGRFRQALKGIAAYALICIITISCFQTATGTLRTMLVAFLGLLHRVYACGMLAGIVIETTKVGEFLSAMTKLHCPQKISIPLAVMLRYLPTVKEDWLFIKDAMRQRDVSPTLWGFLKAPALTVNCIYVPLLTAASKAADELSAASVTRGIENPKPRTCLCEIKMRTVDYAAVLLLALFFAAELWARRGM